MDSLVRQILQEARVPDYKPTEAEEQMILFAYNKGYREGRRDGYREASPLPSIREMGQ